MVKRDSHRASGSQQLAIDFEQRRQQQVKPDPTRSCLHCWLHNLVAGKGLNPNRVDDVLPLLCRSGEYKAIMAFIRLYVGHTTWTSDVMAADIATLLKMNHEQSQHFRYLNASNRQLRNRQAALVGCADPKLRSAA